MAATQIELSREIDTWLLVVRSHAAYWLHMKRQQTHLIIIIGNIALDRPSNQSRLKIKNISFYPALWNSLHADRRQIFHNYSPKKKSLFVLSSIVFSKKLLAYLFHWSFHLNLSSALTNFHFI